MPHEIKDALLIYNPTSGSRRHRRFEEIEHGVRILKDAGITVELAPTTGPETGTKIARQAVEQRRGMVIACGGDGTINEIVNGLARSQVPLAAPSGGNREHSRQRTGHSLGHSPRGAADPGWLDPANRSRHRVSDKSEISGSTIASEGRYFLSVAGAGPDGAIVNGVSHDLKKNAGIFAYWAEGFRQLIQLRLS